MRKYLAEFLGTFVLVFGGVGSAILAGSHIGYVGVAFAFGLAVLAMVYTIGPVSGATSIPLSRWACCWQKESARVTR